MPVQWARLEDGEVLLATSKAAWIHQSQFGGLGLGLGGALPLPASLGLGSPLGLDAPMPDSLPASAETTRHLLDGAIAAAERAAPPVQEPPITALRWAWHLSSQWHCAHHSVALLPDVIERYEATGRPDLAEFARRKLEEERGHDQMPLDDLRALGYEAGALVQAVPPAPAVTAGLEYAGSVVRGPQPVEFLGYVYALERRVLRLSDNWFAALDAVLPPGVDAASGVRLHANELDLGHVDEAVGFFTGLPAADRTAIAIGCYRTTQICCAKLPGQHPSEPKLERWLSRFRRSGAVSGGVQQPPRQGGERE